MLTGCPPREHTFADQALAHLLTDDDEDLADLVGASGARASPSFLGFPCLDVLAH
jgi:coenzyme F420-reducing hydrogenase gamma subunit